MNKEQRAEYERARRHLSRQDRHYHQWMKLALDGKFDEAYDLYANDPDLVKTPQPKEVWLTGCKKLVELFLRRTNES